MTLATLALMLSMGSAQDVVKLGRERSEFGDPVGSPRFHISSYVPSTLILFPAGSSTRRYNITPTGEGALIALSVRKGKRIIPVWTAEARNFPKNGRFRRLPSRGTLERLLFHLDCGILRPNRTVRHSLESVKLFAAYQFMPVHEVLAAGHLTVKGDLRMPEPNDPVWAKSLGSTVKPRTDFPYPVTPEEIAWLQRN